MAVDVGSVGSLAAGSPGEKPLQAAIADYADMALQTLLAAAHGVHDGLPADQLDDAVTRMRTDTGTRMAKLLAQTLRLWSERPADLQTIDDMAHVLISALLVLTADGDQENVLPLLAQLRVGALASGT
ncbi:hypothetical protein [Kitasatospora sp. NPDC088779]|uniref:hypothetical protein n=2 Tax=unclassified Kitasatospora TaxID=2633591 RepID=UPI00343598F4